LSRVWEVWDYQADKLGITNRHKEIMKRIADEIEPNSSLLDVGAGHGYFYNFVKDKNVNYVGVDTSVKMLQIAKQKHPEATVLYGDIYTIHKDLEPRDYVVVIDVLIHLPEIKVPIQNLWETTKSTMIFTIKLAEKPKIYKKNTNRTVKGTVKFPEGKHLFIRWDTIDNILYILGGLDGVKSIEHFRYDARTEIFVVKRNEEDI